MTRARAAPATKREARVMCVADKAALHAHAGMRHSTTVDDLNPALPEGP